MTPLGSDRSAEDVLAEVVALVDILPMNSWSSDLMVDVPEVSWTPPARSAQPVSSPKIEGVEKMSTTKEDKVKPNLMLLNTPPQKLVRGSGCLSPKVPASEVPNPVKQANATKVPTDGHNVPSTLQVPASERPNPPLSLQDPGLQAALEDLRGKRKSVGQKMKSAANESMAAKAKVRAEAKAKQHQDATNTYMLG